MQSSSTIGVSVEAVGSRPELRLVKGAYAHLAADLENRAHYLKLRAACHVCATEAFGIKDHATIEDLISEACLKYLEIVSADPERFDHSEPRSSLKIIYGIFQKRCQVISGRQLSHGWQQRKLKRLVKRLRETVPHRLQGLVIDESVLDAIVRIEEATAVRAALTELSTEAHALLLMLAEQEVTRLKLIEILRVNRNTFDTRLRALRRKLKQLLREHGVEVNAPSL